MNLTYEKAIAELEKSAEKLQSGALSLDETVSVYEEACKLAAHCSALLESAKQKITIMNGEEDGDEL
ncbi:MAG: exodeoxyribonuclease VII small subunit [Oscillospiraceae bacterium]|nr:exodeoxyribonuclease VII small subunit [Oscillospiraceae bacterium]